MADQETNGAGLPYASWTTCLHLIERMEKEGVPRRIDNTYLIGMAGGTQAQVKHALRSLDLIDDEGHTKPRLSALAQQRDQRRQLMADLLRERFPQLTELDLSATRGELDEKIKSLGLNGATARKAATFYLGAAAYANLPLSPHIKPSRPGGSNGAMGGQRRRAKRKPAEPPADNQNGSAPPPGYSTEVVIGRNTKLILTVQNPDPFGLSPSDREFIFGLIDTMKARADASAAETDTVEESS